MTPFLSRTCLALLCLVFTLLARATPISDETSSSAEIDLSGLWDFALGVPDTCFPQGPLPALVFKDSIQLPGTTETRGKGPLSPNADPGSLTRLRKFEGPAWYARDFEIPISWAGHEVILELERTKYTQVWLDGRPLGEQVLYTVAQHYSLGCKLSPGKHRLAIMVDNRLERRPVPAQAHQYSDDTQTNWNGMLGRLRLKRLDLLSIQELRATPNLGEKSFGLALCIRNSDTRERRFRVRATASSFNHAGPALQSSLPESSEVRLLPGASCSLQLRLPLGAVVHPWSEFSPALYRIEIWLEGDGLSERHLVQTGLREFKTAGTQFLINGTPTFLRGKHDGCVFPLTGHPPMEVEGWLHYFRIYQQYGINHIRCHTWVPPEAAFTAADLAGIYLQPELPFWGTFDSKVRDGLMPEARELLRQFGNHPSFVMLTLANEAGGDRKVMNEMVSELRRLDNRHLYADGSNNVLWDPWQQPTNDFWASAKTKTKDHPDKALSARGSFCVFDGDEGHVQWGPSNTRFDLSKAMTGVTIPFVGHETGQWTIYPDFDEITKYTGVVRARNFERFRESARRHGVLEQNKAFARASGLLAAQLYREENELALRSPGFAGFQILDLQDYPGQGSALVGILDAFMDSKGLITPDDWKKSCSPLVLLARFDRYVWTTAQAYEADLQLAHYGMEDLKDARISWSLVSSDNKQVAKGELPTQNIARGGLRSLGSVKIPLDGLPTPAALRFVVRLESAGGTTTNDWPLWLYPESVDTTAKGGVLVVNAWNDQTRELLAKGHRVVLIPDSGNWADTLPGAYATDYWNWPMFNGTPGTLGLLPEPAHPALARFPSSAHSERQWSEIAHASTPVILSEAPSELRPIVQVIDNYERNLRLGLVFEAKVGPGSLLVCASPLGRLRDNPAARQLMYSLLEYAASPAFRPGAEIAPAALDRFLSPSLALRRAIKASSFFRPPWGAVPEPARLNDGDINTRWIAANDDKAPILEINLGGRHLITALELWFENDTPGYRYLIESSLDGQTWAPLSDQSSNHFEGNRHFLEVPACTANWVRLRLLAHPEGARYCLREIRVLGR